MFFILNNVDEHEEVNVNPRLSAKSRSSALSSVLCWAFVTLMNECSDQKRGGGGVVVVVVLNSQATSWVGGMSCSGSYAAGIRHACPCLPPSSAAFLWL